MKRVKFLKETEVNGATYAIGDIIEVPEELAAAMIAAGSAEETAEDVTKREAPAKAVYKYTPKSAATTFDHLSREYSPSSLFAPGGNVVYTKREGVDAILATLDAGLYSLCSVTPASKQGRYQDVLDVDLSEVATKTDVCALGEGTAPKIWGMALGKFGTKVPLCRDDIEDNDLLVGTLNTALRLKLRMGVDNGIVAGSYDAYTGGLMGVLDAQCVTDGSVTVKSVSGAMAKTNVVARLQSVVGAVWLPLRPYVTLMFGGPAWEAYEAFLADNPAKAATVDRAKRTIDGMRYELSPAIPDAVGIAAAYMPAYSIRVKRDLLLERCNSCGADADIFSVSARLTGRLTGKLTGAKLAIGA